MARPKQPFARASLAHFLVAAVVAHEIALAGALALAARGERATAGDSRLGLELLFEAPAFAETARVAPPAEPPPLPALPAARPLAPREPEPTVAPTGAPLAARAAIAASDLVAAAAKILTADDAPDAPSIASGDDTSPGYGLVAGDGQGTFATRAKSAAIGGKHGGVGQDASPSASLGPDRSRIARVIGAYTDDCAFPAEAGDIDHAVVSIVVDVRKDGSAASVEIMRDPGHGFGGAARSCAFRQRFEPARDRAGHAVGGLTSPFNVRFTR